MTFLSKLKPLPVDPTGVAFTGICSVRSERCTANGAIGALTAVFGPRREQINVCQACLSDRLTTKTWVRARGHVARAYRAMALCTEAERARIHADIGCCVCATVAKTAVEDPRVALGATIGGLIAHFTRPASARLPSLPTPSTPSLRFRPSDLGLAPSDAALLGLSPLDAATKDPGAGK